MNPIEQLFIGALTKQIAEVVAPLPPHLGGQAALLVAAALATRGGLSKQDFVQAAGGSYDVAKDFAERVEACDCSTCDVDACPGRTGTNN
jgi:hypothetical protein